MSITVAINFSEDFLDAIVGLLALEELGYFLVGDIS